MAAANPNTPHPTLAIAKGSSRNTKAPNPDQKYANPFSSSISWAVPTKERNSGGLSHVMTRMRTASTGHVTAQDTSWARALAKRMIHTCSLRVRVSGLWVYMTMMKMVMFSHWLIFLKHSPWSLYRQATKCVSVDDSKQNNTCTAVPVRKGSGTVATCGVPSRTTCNEITPGTQPWYIRTYTRKRGLYIWDRHNDDCRWHVWYVVWSLWCGCYGVVDITRVSKKEYQRPLARRTIHTCPA